MGGGWRRTSASTAPTSLSTAVPNVITGHGYRADDQERVKLGYAVRLVPGAGGSFCIKEALPGRLPARAAPGSELLQKVHPRLQVSSRARTGAGPRA